MDSIDITDSVFSLDVPDLNQVIGSVDDVLSNDYTMYIYIGISILVIIIGMFIFKFHQNKKREQSGDDCEGGFCTMNQNT
jgi:uncharacterized membrane protein YfhO